MNSGEAVIADHLPDVTILFADLVGFTRIASGYGGADLVRLLNGLFSEFDRLRSSMGSRRSRQSATTTWWPADCPIRVPTTPAPSPAWHGDARGGGTHNPSLPFALQMRIGIHSGEVVAGVIGTHKFVYDVWGDAVNVASRMESHGLPNRILISAATYQHLHKHFRLEPHGSVDVKGKGLMDTYFLLGRT